jgi:hypothetical protein
MVRQVCSSVSRANIHDHHCLDRIMGPIRNRVSSDNRELLRPVALV